MVVGDRVLDKALFKGTVTYVYKDGKHVIVQFDVDSCELAVDVKDLVRFRPKKKKVKRYKYIIFNEDSHPTETNEYYKDDKDLEEDFDIQGYSFDDYIKLEKTMMEFDR